MSSTFLKILSRYTYALIFAMMLKILIVDFSAAKMDVIAYVDLNGNYAIKYDEVSVSNEVENEEKEDLNGFKKPYFSKNEGLNEIVSKYIDENKCSYLDYNVYGIDNSKLNLFLDCGNPVNTVYNHKTNKEVSFDTLIKDKDAFYESSKRLLALKYPKFVVEDIDYDKAQYDIRSNELIGYYNSKEYGKATVKINYNEIKDMMTYEQNYDDAYDNETFQLDKNKKTIAFTFDDGPSDYDLKIIDALVDSHATATFFLVGNRMRSFPKSIEKMISTKMEVGNHTYDHKSLAGLSNEKIKEQITKTNDIFYEMTKQNIKLLRPSYGAVNSRVQVQVGMPIILWDIDTLDWKSRNAEKVYNEIMKHKSDGSIVLMHSLYASTLEAVKKALPALYKEGYQVVSVGELAKLKGVSLDPGKTILNIK
ncbi:MAG: polysaccharide deacetylase family protein [Bacilli bacterium]|nr:polysaccharide deacetylase family protein [Bacilli bacterium]